MGAVGAMVFNRRSRVLALLHSPSKAVAGATKVAAARRPASPITLSEEAKTMMPTDSFVLGKLQPVTGVIWTTERTDGRVHV